MPSGKNMPPNEHVAQVVNDPPISAHGNEEVASTGHRGPDTPSRKLALAMALLCLLGVAASVELTRIHLFVHTDPTYHSLCAVSEGVNCETVATSPYSVFAGLPVSVWGISGYLLMGVLALWAFSRRRLHAAWPWGVLLLLTVFSACVSAFLAFIAATRIDSICLFCTCSYGINVLLLALSIVASRRSGLSVLELLVQDVRALFVRWRLFLPLVLFGSVTMALLLAFYPHYWETLGWETLPRLASGTDEEGGHFIGALHPKVTIVEFSDYECPHCRGAHKRIRALAAEHPREIRLVHRHLPLDMACHRLMPRPFHGRACLFAEAAECAGLQGRFWEMNDALFSTQDKAKASQVDPMSLAVKLGLDRSEFKECLDTHATLQRIAGDIEESISRKLTGTPTFIVGEQIFVGQIPQAEIERLMNGEDPK